MCESNSIELGGGSVKWEGLKQLREKIEIDKLRFCIVDVFAEEKYAGNQLAVFRNARDVHDGEMRRIAKEMNFSETTFVLSDEERDGGYDVRIFTPAAEVPFAGHPTLGTAYVMQQEVIKEPVEAMTLNLGVGPIRVTFERDGERIDTVWMQQKSPVFGQTFDRDPISQMLSLDKREICDRFPVQEVSTGLPFIVVPMKSLDAVKRANVAKERYFELIKDTQAKAVFIFCPEAYKRENDFNVRMFADYYGVSEDPACGSGVGCLAGYLVKYGYLGRDKIDIRVEEGYEIGRPSLLLARAEDRGEGIDVAVGGRVVMIARGELA